MQRPLADLNKSTNDRYLRACSRAGFRVLRLVPSLAARWAEALFFTPPRHRASSRTREFLASGRRFDLRVSGRRVVAWSWGDGPPVVLVHGWGGLGGQLGAFVPPLLESGFRVVTFDAPGHGASMGRRSSVLHFVAALQAIAATTGAPRAVIAHSLGATAAALALCQGLNIKRAVFLGPPAEPTQWTWLFAERFQIPHSVISAMRLRAERHLRFKWSDLGLEELAGSQKIPLLVIHDVEDDEVPWTDGAAVARAWPGARLLTTTGLRHRKILRDPSVVEQTVAFVAARSAVVEPGSFVSPREADSLDRYLYDREARW
jgi:pimeloyl-ACP methyl ester carboxylesterase